MKSTQKAILALEDGAVFEGWSFGFWGEKAGEVVFNTSMSGYQEILTDHSYKGQIVVMTYPLIGNYGINEEDIESTTPNVEGFIGKAGTAPGLVGRDLVKEVSCQEPYEWEGLNPPLFSICPSSLPGPAHP